MGLKKEKRPMAFPSERQYGFTSHSTAAAAMGPRGVHGLNSTSTDETPFVHTLAVPAAGDLMFLVVESLATSSSPIHVNAGTGGKFDQSTASGSTASDNMITLTSAGAACTLVATSSGRWGVVGNNGCTLSSST